MLENPKAHSPYKGTESEMTAMQETGNQQERLAWLAGLIDGEGHLGIKKGTGRTGRHQRFSGYYLTPRMILANTSDVALERVIEILKVWEMPYHLRWEPAGQNRRNHPIWHLTVSGVKRIPTFLTPLLPYLVIKEEQARTLILYCEERLALPRGRRHSVHVYRDRDLQFYERMKELNQNPQRLHVAPADTRDDIVRSPVKAGELCRNDTAQLRLVS